jgi:hypothetical protein
MKPFDAVVSTMRREEKKNGAGIAYLDYKHPDLDEFISLQTNAAYKAVYIPMHDTPEAASFISNKPLVDKLVKAYNEFDCFLVKRPTPATEPLYVNLCTEVEIPHRGFCVLGVINLSAVPVYMLPHYFKLGALRMLEYTELAIEATDKTRLSCVSPDNKQFGLGQLGFASLIGREGLTYKGFADYLESLFAMVNENPTIEELFNIAATMNSGYTLPTLVAHLLEGYKLATEVCRGKVRAAFCLQPTVTMAQMSFDSEGYHASPEIAPVQGLKHADAVTTIIKSAIKGDKVIHYHPSTPTMDDVEYNDYARVSALWQRIIDSTGLAHRHSHCFYGEQFTNADLLAMYEGKLKYRKSLYYRLPYNVNVAAMDKSGLWQDVEDKELGDFDVDALLAGASCKQVAGTLECDCQM